MKLISCHIDNFGRLRNFDFSFADGLNIVLHENGWGKTTFAAFLCAVFYGLPGNRRRSGRENERERYRPWQGGVYGGSLLFETGGRIYEVIRIFGRRESEDEFELRDAETNLPDFRFSEKLGEELFAVDRESFRRTVFIAQADCATQATDGIHALLADLSEREGDLGSYDAAMKRLTDAANRMTPKRKTGSLYRRLEEIRLLERETAGEGKPEEKTAELETELREEADREKALESRLRDLESRLRDLERQLGANWQSFGDPGAEDGTSGDSMTGNCAPGGRAGHAYDASPDTPNAPARKRFDIPEGAEPSEEEAVLRALAAQEMLVRRMRRTEQIRQEAVLEAAAVFPGRIPARPEVDRILRECRSLDLLEYRMQEYMLSEEEQDRLTELEKKYAERPAPPAESPEQQPARKKTADSGSPSAEKRHRRHRKAADPAGYIYEPSEKKEASGAPKRHRKTAETAADPAGKRVLHWLSLAAGLIAAAAGFCLLAGGRPVIGGALAAAGAVLTGAVTVPRFFPPGAMSGQASDLSAFSDSDEDDLRGSGQAAGSRAEYTALQEKERKLEETHARWAETRRPVVTFLRDLGFEPEDDLRSQLERIRDAADDYEDAQTLLREAQQERRNAESETPGDIKAEAEKHRVRGRLLKEAEEVRKELLCCRQRMEDSRIALGELYEEQEAREADLQRLQSMREEQEKETADYHRVITAATLLQRARESLSTRYADPVRRNFSRYWETVTAAASAGVYLDANYAVSIEEMERQREIACFSSGYRDLAGICLRIALADAMYRSPSAACPPLVLDDPFANLDDEKMDGALRLLRKASEKYQILYFTCSRSRSFPQ